MKMVAGLKTLLLILSFSLHAKTLQVDTVTPSVTNGDFTITPNGTGDILLGSSLTGFLKAASGVVSAQATIDLTTDVGATVAPIANGGTNSSTALNNDFVMISSSGAIVEDSNVSVTELSYLDTVSSNIQTQLNAKAADVDVVKLTGDQAVAGRKTFSGEIDATGVISSAVTTDSSSTGANVTLSTPTTETVRLTNASLTSIDMITAPTRAQKLTLVNHTGSSIAINDTTGVTGANQIMTGIAANLTLLDQGSLNIVYDVTETKWMVSGINSAGVEKSTVTGHGNGGTVLTASVTDIDWTQTLDADGLYDGTTFTPDTTGFYSYSGTVRFTANCSAGSLIVAYVDTVSTEIAGVCAGALTAHLSGSIKLTSGEDLTFRVNTNLTLSNNSITHHLAIIQDNAQ